MFVDANVRLVFHSLFCVRLAARCRITLHGLQIGLLQLAAGDECVDLVEVVLQKWR